MNITPFCKLVSPTQPGSQALNCPDWPHPAPCPRGVPQCFLSCSGGNTLQWGKHRGCCFLTTGKYPCLPSWSGRVYCYSWITYTLKKKKTFLFTLKLASVLLTHKSIANPAPIWLSTAFPIGRVISEKKINPLPHLPPTCAR